MDNPRAQYELAMTTMTRVTNGGQHRAPIGVSTLDGETDTERIERLRRVYADLGEEFDEDKVKRAYRKQEIGDHWANAELVQYGNQAGWEW